MHLNVEHSSGAENMDEFPYYSLDPQEIKEGVVVHDRSKESILYEPELPPDITHQQQISDDCILLFGEGSNVYYLTPLHWRRINLCIEMKGRQRVAAGEGVLRAVELTAHHRQRLGLILGGLRDETFGSYNPDKDKPQYDAATHVGNWSIISDLPMADIMTIPKGPTKWEAVKKFPQFTKEYTEEYENRIRQLIDPRILSELQYEFTAKTGIVLIEHTFTLAQQIAFFSYYNSSANRKKRIEARMCGMHPQCINYLIPIFEICPGNTEFGDLVLQVIEDNHDYNLAGILENITHLNSLKTLLPEFQSDRAKQERDRMALTYPGLFDPPKKDDQFRSLFAASEPAQTTDNPLGIWSSLCSLGASIRSRMPWSKSNTNAEPAVNNLTAGNSVDMPTLHSLIYKHTCEILEGPKKVDKDYIDIATRKITLASIFKAALNKPVNVELIEQIEEIVGEVGIEVFPGGNFVHNNDKKSMDDPTNYIHPDLFSVDEYRMLVEILKEIHSKTPEYLDHLIQDLVDAISNPDNTIIILKDGNKPTGVCITGKVSDDPLVYHLDYLYVDPEYRQEYKVGQFLQKIARSFIPDKAEIIATVSTFNFPAMARHIETGAIGVGTSKPKAATNTDAQVLELRNAKYEFLTKDRTIFSHKRMQAIAEDHEKLDEDNITIIKTANREELLSSLQEQFGDGYVLTRFFYDANPFPCFLAFEKPVN